MPFAMRTETGDGWAVGSVDGLGSGPGFRKIRNELGVTEFGVNAIVLPPAYESRRHLHERQQELYVVLEGEIEFRLGDERRGGGRGGAPPGGPAAPRRPSHTPPPPEARS